VPEQASPLVRPGAETPLSSEIIRLSEVTKVYRKPGAAVEVHALRGISFAIEEGELVAVVGASGSGKSTLMNIIGCLDRPTAGAYYLGGQDVSRMSDDELSDVRGQRIGFIFQNFNLIQSQTVLENLETPSYYQGLPPRERRAKATAIAGRVGLEARLDHRPTELSGGQQQRVAIARALMNDPLLLLADEPTGNLDSETGKVILALLRELNDAGMTIVLVTHDANVAQACKRVIEFSDGRIASDRTEVRT
jgi:putative ABC transport system ATP-binding protein